MIKKLVKYGNSQALVLDKALLEILGITEQSKLKLTTDGTSLTMTPVKETAGEQALPVSFVEGEAAMHWQALQLKKNGCPVPNFATVDPVKLQAMMQEQQVLLNRYNKEHNYFQRSMELTSNTAYKAECAALGERAYHAAMSVEEYGLEHQKLLQKFLPDIPVLELHKEMEAINNRHKN